MGSGPPSRRMAWLLWPLLALAAGTAAAEPRTMEYSSPDQSVWTTRKNPAGEPENPLLRLAAPLFERAGIPWRARVLPAARLFDYLRDGQTDFSMLVRNPALDGCCLLSRQPVAATELRVYRRKDRPAVTDRRDLAGKEVITIHGYSYGALLAFIRDPANGVVNHGTSSHEAAFAMLERGRADYVLDYAGPAEEVLARQPVDGLAHDVIDRLDVHLVLSRAYPDAEKVMARLEAAAAGLRVDGLSPPPAK